MWNCDFLEGDGYVQVDITKDRGSLIKWQKIMEKQINECRFAYEVFYLVNDAYRMLFFHDVARFLSKEDFASLLGSVWVGSDYANCDMNVSKKSMLNFFKQADKALLMTESELEYFNALEESFIIYRGVSRENRNVKALSWTTSFGKAKWFADRWGKGGVVYSASIDKEDVCAYFDRKNEDEVVVDFNKLKNIKSVTKPISKCEKPSREMD